MLVIEAEVLVKAKAGCSDSFITLFDTYKPIIYKMRRHYFLKGYDLDDWLQEGRIVCYQSLKTYDEDLGRTFGYYFKLNFERRVYSLIRRQEASKRTIDRNCESLDERNEKYGNDYISQPEEKNKLIISYVIIRDRLPEYNEQLSLLENNVLTLYISGKNFREIGQELSIREEAARYAYNRIKSKFKVFLK